MLMPVVRRCVAWLCAYVGADMNGSHLEMGYDLKGTTGVQLPDQELGGGAIYRDFCAVRRWLKSA